MGSTSVTVSVFLALTICLELAPQNRLLAQQPQSSAPRAEPTREEREQKLRILRGLRGAGLHDAAVANGGSIVVDVNPHADFVRIGKLESLGDLSEVVIAGTVRRVESKLSPNGLSIVAYNTIDVSETIKGTSPGQVVVALTGGKVRFDDGSTAEMTASGYTLRVGGRYVLFVR